MTPRPLKEEGVMLASDSSTTSAGQGYGPHFTYEKSGLTAGLSFCCESDNKEPDLHKSLKELNVNCSKLLESVDGNVGVSPTLAACQGSLRNDMSSMLGEANVLLKNIGKHTLVTPWRASLAQSRIDSYLETIKLALASRDQIDDKLAKLTSSISSQTSDEKDSESPPVQISSWRTPSLCFDLVVGQRTEYVSKEKMPIIIRARAIAEVRVMELDAGTVPEFRACRVTVEECKHEERTMFSMAGTVGEALVKVRISLLDTSAKKTTTWGEDAEVGLVRVQEARIVQPNAFPPLPKRSADLYISSFHGSSDICVMLKFKTQRVLETDGIPEIDIDLVMASTGEAV